MSIERADVVRSLAGRDQGQCFYVLEVQGEYLLLADGKGRRVEAPKRKKCKHVQRLPAAETGLTGKIREGMKITNSELRKAILAISDQGNQDQEG